jgi:hypothetical protein
LCLCFGLYIYFEKLAIGGVKQFIGRKPCRRERKSVVFFADLLTRDHQVGGVHE